jgi:DNA-directed RNA polymerase subunit RPC12/RpoP
MDKKSLRPQKLPNSKTRINSKKEKKSVQGYNLVCEDCGHEWEAAYDNDQKADAAKCPDCGSQSTQAYHSGD